MGEKFSYSRNSGKFSAWAFLWLVTRDRIDPIMVQPKLEIDVEVRIDGKEVSFHQLMEQLEKAFEQQVKASAAELLQERFGVIADSIERIGDDAVAELRVGFGLSETKKG